ncbi:MAG: FAD-dependent oxidoreductase [Xylanivirga thermophila]|uniref:FAD-dependent oxidoreductase n=1 Tax=Xylanivirga thermophila TaxID=2496273 RepID=UPI00101BA2E9|nr:FAD-dependent oxidoreductase [Xylanivirga thermophila]
MQRAYKADVIIIGGSLGGCAAALAAARMGKKVIMTEETKWIGGQLTSQAVPPDENPWIEKFGCTMSYRQLRNGIRTYYKNHFPLTPEARQTFYLNPGNGNVSKLCHDPRVAVAVLHEMMAPYILSNHLVIWTRHKIQSVEVDNNHVRSMIVKNLDTGDEKILTGSYFLDATECGDVLPLAKAEYITGAESKQGTGEPHALEGEADPLDIQSITWCFAIDHVEGEDNTIEKPEQYDFWKNYRCDFWPDSMLSWKSSHPHTLETREHTLFPVDERHSLWTYRRIADRNNFVPGTFDSDITIANWPQNDYWLGPIYEVDEEEANKHLEGARQLSLSYLYWLQTEAPRPDGGIGYPGLRLRNDVVGTEDGLAMYPYIRESRRIKAEFTILEQYVSPITRGDEGAVKFEDSVGIGYYRMDLHPSTSGRNYIDIGCLPFQIPLGSLIPVRMENLIPACKNIGTTHITNGSYRLHPVEWNIGEAAGMLVSYAMDKKISPRVVRNDNEYLADFQQLLRKQGVELEWPKI